MAVTLIKDSLLIGKQIKYSFRVNVVLPSNLTSLGRIRTGTGIWGDLRWIFNGCFVMFLSKKHNNNNKQLLQQYDGAIRLKYLKISVAKQYLK